MNTISIDYFGTLDIQPSFWRETLKFAKMEGTEVYVISGPWPKDIVEKLEYGGYTRGIHYDKVFSILSYLSGNGLHVQFSEERDSWQSDETAWWRSKAEICRKIGSKVHFDNDVKFATNFKNVPTRFVHTECQARIIEIEKWSKELKTANTFTDWGDEYYSGMMGPM